MAKAPQPARILPRLAAGVVDCVVQALAVGVLLALFTLVSAVIALGWVLSFIIVVLVAVLYYPFFETSEWQASPGKRLFSLRVVDAAGEPVGFGRSLGRCLLFFLSVKVFFLGFLPVLFTKTRWSLHDKISKTQVVE